MTPAMATRQHEIPGIDAKQQQRNRARERGVITGNTITVSGQAGIVLGGSGITVTNNNIFGGWCIVDYANSR
jgi:parallel beta-helix repeat protein